MVAETASGTPKSFSFISALIIGLANGLRCQTPLLKGVDVWLSFHQEITSGKDVCRLQFGTFEIGGGLLSYFLLSC